MVHPHRSSLHREDPQAALPGTSPQLQGRNTSPLHGTDGPPQGSGILPPRRRRPRGEVPALGSAVCAPGKFHTSSVRPLAGCAGGEVLCRDMSGGVAVLRVGHGGAVGHNAQHDGAVHGGRYGADATVHGELDGAA